jgi:hypothetical protein
VEDDAEDGDADDVDPGDYSSPASLTHSKARKLPTHYYDERDADEDSEEEYSARSEDGSNDNDEEDSEKEAGKCHSTSPFCIFHFIQSYLCIFLFIQNITFYSENAPYILFLL